MVGGAGEAGNGWPTGQIQQFHDHLNSIEPTIKFTIKLEQEGSRPFLDTRLMRHSDGSRTITVFRKKNHLDRYLDCNSHYPLAHKVAVVRTLLTRVDRICFNIPDRDVEKKQVAGALSNNSYSTGLVKRNWQPSPHEPTSIPEPDTCRAVVVILYIRQLSESIRRILSLLGIRTCFKPHHALRQALVKLRTASMYSKKAGLIYRIHCKDCTKVYVGQTSRSLAHRLKEHQ